MEISAQSLYHLDAVSPSGGKADLGPLPGTAVALLAGLGIAWVLILAYLVRQQLKKRRKASRRPETGEKG